MRTCTKKPHEILVTKRDGEVFCPECISERDQASRQSERERIIKLLEDKRRLMMDVRELVERITNE